MPTDLFAGLDTTATLADFDVVAALAANPIELSPAPKVVALEKFAPENPKPDWAFDRDRRQPRRKKPWHERAVNPCRCHTYVSTGSAPLRADRRPITAADLCICQVRLAFTHCHLRPITAEDLKSLFHLGILRERFRCEDPWEMPTQDDVDHVNWIVEMNRDEWLNPVTNAPVYPTREPTDEERLLAETCPPMAALVAARDSGDWKAVRRAYRAYEGWLRETGQVKLTDPKKFGPLFWVTVDRERHHTH